MTQHTQWSDIDLGRLADRDLLILAVQRLNDLASHVEMQNGRIRKLEQYRDQAIGALLIISMLVSAATAWLIKAMT